MLCEVEVKRLISPIPQMQSASNIHWSPVGFDLCPQTPEPHCYFPTSQLVKGQRGSQLGAVFIL